MKKLCFTINSITTGMQPSTCPKGTEKYIYGCNTSGTQPASEEIQAQQTSAIEISVVRKSCPSIGGAKAADTRGNLKKQGSHF